MQTTRATPYTNAVRGTEKSGSRLWILEPEVGDEVWFVFCLLFKGGKQGKCFHTEGMNQWEGDDLEGVLMSVLCAS